MRGYGPFYLAFQTAPIVWVIKAAIDHRNAITPQCFGKMPHCRKQKCNFAFVMFDIGHFGADLGHQHDICFDIDIAQTRQLVIKLIPKNKAQHRHAGPFKAAKAASASSRDVLTSTIGCG